MEHAQGCQRQLLSLFLQQVYERPKIINKIIINFKSDKKKDLNLQI